MIIDILHKSYGKHQILIDDEDINLYKKYSCMIWTTSRYNSYYVVTTRSKGNNFKYHRLHRLIMKAKKNEIVDHINGNALDNRKCNLRITNSFGNNQNARKRKNAKTSIYKGVSKITNSNRWIVQIQVNKKHILVGRYSTELEAAKAYNYAAIKYFGEFAYLNNLKDSH